MKIRKLRFKNLNSLVGTWECDFTNPEYLSSGIFAITGPTGAGKSTILDAICLALYGQTPRLGAITKTNNEIMSRHTGHSFAELEFSTNKGIYRCYWEQSKTRKNSHGNLQSVQRELADISNNNKVLEFQNNNVNKKIIEITGMDFKHFTRAMLLAQGDFAKFLQATPDERSPILEQITGTKIYSEISLKVHERKNNEQKKLELINTELSAINLLDDNEIIQLEIQITSTQNDYNQISKMKLDLDNQLRWLDELQHIEAELHEAQTKKSDLNIEVNNFIPKAKRLDKAQMANEIGVLCYNILIKSIKEYDNAVTNYG